MGKATRNSLFFFIILLIPLFFGQAARADDAVSTCLQVAAAKLKAGDKITVFSKDSLITTGDFSDVDSTMEYLIVSGEEFPDGRMRFAASEINAIKYGGGIPKFKYLMAGACAGFVLGAIICNVVADDKGGQEEIGWGAIEDNLGVFWGCFSAVTIGGVVLAITNANPKEIKCDH